MLAGLSIQTLYCDVMTIATGGNTDDIENEGGKVEAFAKQYSSRSIGTLRFYYFVITTCIVDSLTYNISIPQFCCRQLLLLPFHRNIVSRTINISCNRIIITIKYTLFVT